jgi:hypothetical protein
MKKMTVYANSSVYVFEEVYTKYIFEMNDSKQLIITNRDPVTGMESIYACFNTWDYFMLEEET